MNTDQNPGQETPVVNDEANADAALQTNAEPNSEATEGAEKVGEPQVEKTYTKQELQDHLERATAKAAAKAERRAFREATERLSQVQQPVQERRDEPPARRDGESDIAYIDRFTDWKLEQREQKTQQSKYQEQGRELASKTERLYAEAEKIAGFDREDFDSLPLTPAMASALTDSDVAPKLMAYMTSNPDEVARIAKLSPARQAAELGKWEDRLSTKSPSKAPPPISPIGSKGKSLADPNNMSFSEYERWRASEAGR